MSACRLWAWEGVSLEKHLCCTSVVAELLYGHEWRWAVGRLGLWELEPALRVAALLHDIGKALHKPPSFRCHEVEGGVLLASLAAEALSLASRLSSGSRPRGMHTLYALITANLTTSPTAGMRKAILRDAALTALAGIAAYLHHHGMGSRRYRDCSLFSPRLVAYRWRRVGSCAAKRIERVAEEAAPEAMPILARMSALTYISTTGGVVEVCSRALTVYLEERGFKPGEPLAGKLATLITGFVSVADSLAALVEGRGERSVDCSKPRRYYDRVVCEMSGWSTERARTLIEELREACTTKCRRWWEAG